MINTVNLIIEGGIVLTTMPVRIGTSLPTVESGASSAALSHGGSYHLDSSIAEQLKTLDVKCYMVDGKLVSKERFLEAVDKCLQTTRIRQVQSND